MARIFQSGFELQSVTTEFPTIVTEGSATFTIVTTAPRTGSAHLRVSNVAGGNKVYGIHSLPYAVSELYIRAGLQINSWAAGVGVSELFSLWDGAIDHILVTLNQSKQLAIYRDSTLLATDSTVLATGVYYLLEFHFSIANSGGIIQIKINGVLSTDTTADTQNAGNASVNTIQIGETENVNTSTKSVMVLYWDDWAINDASGSRNNTWIGDGGIYLLTPTGAGTTTQLSRGGNDSGANWNQVDEVPQNGTTDYVYAAAAGSADTYALSDVPGAVNTASLVNAARWVAHVAQDVAGAGSVTRYIRTNSTNYEGSAFGLPVGTVFTEVSEIIQNNPNTSAAWTIAELNNLEAGVMTR